MYNLINPRNHPGYGTTVSDKGVKELIKKGSKDSSYGKDFLAGVEPTGVYTFRNAVKNKSKDTQHRLMGNLGGFIGGSATSIALSGLGTAGVGLALRKYNPAMSKTLVEGGKEAFKTFNPRYVYKTLKRFPESLGLVKNTKDLAESAVKANKAFEGKTYADVANKLRNLKPEDAKKYVDYAMKGKKSLEAESAFAKKHGVGSIEAFGSGVATTGGLAVAGLGGAMNTVSANAQYSAGKNQRKYMK